MKTFSTATVCGWKDARDNIIENKREAAYSFIELKADYTQYGLGTAYDSKATVKLDRLKKWITSNKEFVMEIIIDHEKGAK